MSDDLCGIYETYLLMHVEIAHRLGDKMRRTLAAEGGYLSRGESHRLIESVHAIADITGEAPHDVWVQYVGTGLCGSGCDHKVA